MKDLPLEPGGRVGKNKARCSWIVLYRLSEVATARIVGYSGTDIVHFDKDIGVGSPGSVFCTTLGVAKGRRY